MIGHSSERSEAGAVVHNAPRDTGGRINALEIGRGLAALAVVLFHSNVATPQFDGPYFEWMRVTEYGVDFFFVLSGFIIYTAHARDIGISERAALYFKRRCIRLFPILWAVALGFAAARLMSGLLPDLPTLLRSLFPYPTLEAPLPLPIWTLRHEILFYAAFGVLIFAPRWGKGLFLLWGLACMAQFLASLSGHALEGAISLPLSSYTLDFFFGMGVARLHAMRSFRPSVAPLALGLAALVILLVATDVFGLARRGFTDYVSFNATVWTAARGVVFAVIVHGLVRIEPWVAAGNPLVRLGAASYAIYLVHSPANSVLQRIAAHMPEAMRAVGAGHLFLIVGGVTAGFLLHYEFERPIGAYLRKKYIRTEC